MTHILISCMAMQPRLNGCGKLMLVAGSAGPTKAEAKGNSPFNRLTNFLGTARFRFHNQGLSFISPFLEGVVAGTSRLYCRTQGLSCVKKSPANAPTLAIIS